MDTAIYVGIDVAKAQLDIAIVVINAWNRIAISTRMAPKETAA